ncbi:hypothetical protein ACIBBE_45065, partial [Streptomyces sp. NPDC051644]|uniref:hypothetical protein n=1 Tax=Streptomyces sp. NPDC051644 TaxID=3365666 RepID=UPI00379242C9
LRRVLRHPQRELLSYGSSRSNDQGVHDQGETPLLFSEYAELLPMSARGYDVAAGRAKVADVVPDAIVGLADDMRALTTEIFEHCRKATG